MDVGANIVLFTSSLLRFFVAFRLCLTGLFAPSSQFIHLLASSLSVHI